MSALQRFVFRPLAFPAHRWAALVDLSTGHVVALQRAGVDASTPLPAADAPASGEACRTSSNDPDRTAGLSTPAHGSPARRFSAGGNASRSRVATAERLAPTLALVS